MGPLILNAFDLIILSQGLNLSALFERGEVRFTCIFIVFHSYIYIYIYIDGYIYIYLTSGLAILTNS